MLVLVTGGAGYVGSRLVPKLLGDGHSVRVIDNFWFGNAGLPENNDSLKLIKGDIRDKDAVASAMAGCNAVLHLACLSNDYSCQLDEPLSEAINIASMEPFVRSAISQGVQRFIYCSSSSVYGINDAPEVTEDMPCVPLTLYNRSKMLCEEVLAKYRKDFGCVTVIRPATVCGPAPRMRFDLTVNVMTMHAVMKREITVFGGEQKRPNLHIDDMCDVYRLLLDSPFEKIHGETFNVGRQNLKVIEIAQLIKQVVEREIPGNAVKITVQPSQDNRTYRINSDRIKRVLGFEASRTVEQAIVDICTHFQMGRWKDALVNPEYSNVLQYVQKHGMGKK